MHDPCQLAGNQGCRVLVLCVLSGLFRLECGRFILFPLVGVVRGDRGGRGDGRGVRGGYPLTFP
jgi:hypothetical protein